MINVHFTDCILHSNIEAEWRNNLGLRFSCNALPRRAYVERFVLKSKISPRKFTIQVNVKIVHFTDSAEYSVTNRVCVLFLLFFQRLSDRNPGYLGYSDYLPTVGYNENHFENLKMADEEAVSYFEHSRFLALGM